MFADAEAYGRFMGRWSRRMAPLLVDFAGVPDRGRILDVGSGTGSLALTIAERKPHCRVEGIDVSREYVAYAAKRNRGDRVRFQVGDAQRPAPPSMRAFLFWSLISSRIPAKPSTKCAASPAHGEALPPLFGITVIACGCCVCFGMRPYS
ncbi:MAG TPA: class I SAM-dependent methyltransferase [Bryobacterales bacterium]|nr:class I SAM-dependent methyltransferase [Bryobacterales bacterium]